MQAEEYPKTVSLMGPSQQPSQQKHYTYSDSYTAAPEASVGDISRNFSKATQGPSSTHDQQLSHIRASYTNHEELDPSEQSRVVAHDSISC